MNNGMSIKRSNIVEEVKTMKYDVVIVGAGPSGISCAIELQKNGISNCVIDKCDFPRKKLCGGLITQKTYNLISGLFHDESDLEELFAESKTTQDVWFFNIKELVSTVRTNSIFRIVDRESFDYSMLKQYLKMGGVFYSGETVDSLDCLSKKIFI